MKKPYTAATGNDQKPCVDGPGDGFGYYAGTLWPDMRFSSKADAEAAAKCCNEAYRQGHMAAQQTIRVALGIKDTP